MTSRIPASASPPEQKERIFESFTQIDAGAARRYGGNGLGLTIARRLAALLGGSLTFSSEPANGSVFSLVIPCCLEDAAVPMQAGNCVA